MKKPANKSAKSDMRQEYDFSRGIRGKSARRRADGSNVVVLALDVAKVFPDADASLRALAGIIRWRSKSLPLE